MGKGKAGGKGAALEGWAPWEVTVPIPGPTAGAPVATNPLEAVPPSYTLSGGGSVLSHHTDPSPPPGWA